MRHDTDLGLRGYRRGVRISGISGGVPVKKHSRAPPGARDDSLPGKICDLRIGLAPNPTRGSVRILPFVTALGDSV